MQEQCGCESKCEYGKADSIENMVGCDWKSGVKVCSVWRHSSCAGGVVKGNWFCSKNKVTESMSLIILCSIFAMNSLLLLRNDILNVRF